jgi:RNA polymerase sigma factor (sigma-70 family)
VAIKVLAKRTCRPRSAVYRVLLEERISKLNRRKVKFIDDELYHQSDAEMMVESLAKEHDTIDVSPARSSSLSSSSLSDELRMPRDVPSAIASLCSAPLLTPARERALFLKFNYHKMRFVTARRRLEPDFARVRDLNLLEGHLRRAAETKNLILRSNLRLVVSIARKHLRSGLSLMELVSDGTMTLMRAIESFDTHRGNKFSTYATLALMKGFARSVPQMLASHTRGRGQQSEEFAFEIPDRRATAAAERFLAREEVGQLLQRLDSRERDVVRGHFGLGESAPATYDQLAQRLGLSKERVRQIERVALAKLRGERD